MNRHGTTILLLFFFTAVLRADPLDQAEVLFRQGVAAYKKGDDAAAMDAFSKALAYNPNNSQVQQYIVLTGQRILQKEKKLESLTWADLQEIVNRAQDVIDDRRREMRRSLETIKTAYEQSLRREPEALLKTCRGVDLQLQIALGDDEESLQIKNYLHSICRNLEKNAAAGLLHREVDIRRVAGYIAYCHNDWEKALEEWKSARELDPSDAHLNFLIARTKENIGKARAVAVIFQKMDEARRFIDKKKLSDAADLLRQILVLDPAHRGALDLLEETEKNIQEVARRAAAEERRRRAREFQKKGLWLDSAREWLELLELNPLDEEARASLSRLKNDLPRSTEEETPETDPAESQRLYTLGLMSYSEGDLKSALAYFQKSLALDVSNDYARRALERVKAEESFQ